MNCNKFNDILLDNDIIDIPSNIRIKMDEHRDNCIACSQAWEDEYLFNTMIKNLPEPEIDDATIETLHHNIMASVRRESFKQMPEKKTSFFQFKSLFPTVSVAAAALFFGILIGNFLQGPGGGGLNSQQQFSEMIKQYDINNIDIEVVNHTTGELAIEFQQSRDQKVEGNINDPYIQKLLAYAMVKDKNPGTRLRSVKLSQEMNPSDDIQTALIITIRMDENQGVRLKALKALKAFPINDTIRDICVYVIGNDDYPPMRMEAIQILTNTNAPIENDDILKKAAKDDEAEGVKSLINQYYNNLQGNPLEKQ